MKRRNAKEMKQNFNFKLTDILEPIHSDFALVIKTFRRNGFYNVNIGLHDFKIDYELLVELNLLIDY